jgi:hypothetical protein
MIMGGLLITNLPKNDVKEMPNITPDNLDFLLIW